jgi:hypothetical protein
MVGPLIVVVVTCNVVDTLVSFLQIYPNSHDVHIHAPPYVPNIRRESILSVNQLEHIIENKEPLGILQELEYLTELEGLDFVWCLCVFVLVAVLSARYEKPT